MRTPMFRCSHVNLVPEFPLQALQLQSTTLGLNPAQCPVDTHLGVDLLA